MTTKELFEREKDLYERVDLMELTLHPKLIDKILTCGDGLHIQVNADMETGEVWGDLCIGNDWMEYHDDDIITVGDFSAYKAEFLVGSEEDWDDEDEYREELVYALTQDIGQKTRQAIFCELVDRREYERGNRDFSAWSYCSYDDFSGLTSMRQIALERGLPIV